MIVEFFGPSCAGKTTLIADIMRRLARSGIASDLHNIESITSGISRKDDILWALRKPQLLLWRIANLRQARSRSGLRFITIIGVRERIQPSARIGIVDEGPLKRLAIQAEHSRGRKLLARAVPRPDLAVLVTCDFDKRLSRMRDAGRAHVRSVPIATLRERDRAKAQWNEWICDTLGLRILRIDTSDDQDHSETLASEIARQFLTG